MSHLLSLSDPNPCRTMTSKPASPAGRPLGPLDADAASRLLSAATDVALVIDRDGVVRDVRFRSASLEADLGGAASLTGQAWTETVTLESRPKARSLLEAALNDDVPRLRHLNHLAAAPGSSGEDVAVEYAVIRADDEGRVVAFGRDLRPLTELQQRLIDAQQAVERDYASLRQAQTRYRILFETSPESLMVLDAQSLKVAESNPAGRRLAGARRAQGWLFSELFEPRDRGAVLRFLAAVKAGGRAEPVRVRLADAGAAGAGHAGAAGPADATAQARSGGLAEGDMSLSASLLIEGDSSVLLVRVTPGAVASGATLVSEVSDRLLSALEQAPDAFVTTDGEGTILAANAAFLSMTQLPLAGQVQGRALGTWLGRAGVDVDVLLANLRQRGSVRLFSTMLRGEHGLVTEVEISAVAVLGGVTPSFGFAIRDVARRLSAATAPEVRAVVPRSVEQLTGLIGRVSLKELVRDATDVIEKLCIEAALELAEDNRASAAEMLGVSRQSLYAKLHRYGLGDLPEAGSNWEGS